MTGYHNQRYRGRFYCNNKGHSVIAATPSKNCRTYADGDKFSINICNERIVEGICSNLLRGDNLICDNRLTTYTKRAYVKPIIVIHMNAVGLRDHFLTNTAADTAGIRSDTFSGSVRFEGDHTVVPRMSRFAHVRTTGVVTVSITCIGIAMTGINTEVADRAGKTVVCIAGCTASDIAHGHGAEIKGGTVAFGIMLRISASAGSLLRHRKITDLFAVEPVAEHTACATKLVSVRFRNVEILGHIRRKVLVGNLIVCVAGCHGSTVIRSKAYLFTKEKVARRVDISEDRRAVSGTRAEYTADRSAFHTGYHSLHGPVLGGAQLHALRHLVDVTVRCQHTVLQNNARVFAAGAYEGQRIETVGGGCTSLGEVPSVAGKCL